MKQVAPLNFTTAAPVALANPQTAVVGTAATVTHSDGKPLIPQAATPTVLVFGQAPVVGAGARFADDLHQHGLPSTWTKVAAGQFTSVASLDLAALTTYCRYHLLLNWRISTPGTTNWQTTLKLNNDTAHDSVGMKVTAGAVSAISSLATATVVLANNGANVTTYEMLDVTVVHDDANNRRTLFNATDIRQQQGATTGALVVDGGQTQTITATITEILSGFGITADDGDYVLYGSKEIA